MTPHVTNSIQIQLVKWGVTNRDVLLLATLRYFFLTDLLCWELFAIHNRNMMKTGTTGTILLDLGYTFNVFTYTKNKDNFYLGYIFTNPLF